MRLFLYVFVFMMKINYSTLNLCDDSKDFQPYIYQYSYSLLGHSDFVIFSSPNKTDIYKVKYWHINYLGCTKNESDGFIKERDNFLIQHVFPFSQYGLRIWFVKDKLSCISETTSNTLPSVVLNYKEKPIITHKFTAVEAFVSIRWECQHLWGPLSRDINITCVSQPCTGDTIEYTKNETVTEVDVRFSIIQQTTYILKINYERGDDRRSEEYTIYTRLQEPNKVRKSVAYNVNETSVSLRWLPPDPPTGYIEMYEVTYYYDVNDKKTITVDESSYCRMWTEYICTTINDSKFLNKTYVFQIRAKNQDIEKFGEFKTMNLTFNSGKVPSPPLNINYTWYEDRSVKIEWEHPDIPNGQILQFNINIFQEIPFTYSVIKERLYYNYEVDMSNYNLRSKKLFIEIAAVNGIGISSVGQSFSVRPTFSEQPRLRNITDSTFAIEIPPAQTYRDMGKLYVIIVDMESPIEHRELHPKERLLFHIKGVKKENAWISGEYDLNNTTRIAVGTNTTSVSNIESDWTFFDRSLKSDHLYNTTLLLLDIYYGYNLPLAKYFSYSLPVKTLAVVNVSSTDSPTDYPDDSIRYVWSLLSVPVLLFVVCAIIIKRRSSKTASSDKKDLANTNTNPLKSQFINEVDIYDEIILDDRNFTKLVNIQELDEYIKNSIENDELIAQYQMLPEGFIKLHSEGGQLPNMAKNRHSKLIAYDANRVKLKMIEEDPFSSYINANYIDGYNTRKTYIATQTPTDNTYNDFWRMIWQENVKYIIIASDLTEAEKEKDSGIYWPDLNEEMDFGDIRILFRNVQVMANYEIRHFSLFSEHQERLVQQLHFSSTPEYNRVPLYIHSLASFMKRVLSISEEESPIVVHCSDGIGYTGIIILCDICLRMAISESQMDVFFQLYKLRKQRINMVSSLEQYKVVHFVLLRVLECLMIPTETGIICDKTMEAAVENILATKIPQQMKYLEESSWQNDVMRDMDFFYESIRTDRTILDSEESPQSQVYRCTTIDDGKLFITTTVVDSFSTPCKFIVTSSPFCTFGLFWQYIFYKQINVILCLNEMSLIPNYEVFSPWLTLEVRCTDFRINEYFEVYTLYANESNNEENRLKVSIIHILQWPSDMIHPQNANSLIMAFEEMNKLGTAGGPILITCHDGIQASSLFVSMCFLIEKIRTEHICDVCLAVKSIRQSRKDYVRHEEQFTFLYRCALEYVHLFKMYSNFDLLVNDEQSDATPDIY